MKKKENCLLSSSKLQLQMYLPDLTDFYSLPAQNDKMFAWETK